jgi:hypothetical protein
VLSLLGETALKVGDLKKAQQMYRALLLQKLDDGGPIKKALVFVRLRFHWPASWAVAQSTRSGAPRACSRRWVERRSPCAPPVSPRAR